MQRITFDTTRDRFFGGKCGHTLHSLPLRFVCDAFIALVCFVGLLVTSCEGQSPDRSSDGVQFERDIRALFSSRCTSCHGANRQEAGLRLDARSFVFELDGSSSVLNAHEPDSSALIKRIESQDPAIRMPPDGEALPANEIAMLREWIKQGALWEETDLDRKLALDTRGDHWAWKPLQHVSVPLNEQSDWVKNPVDAFVLNTLSQNGLQPNSEASRAQLVRRLYIDLIGLPPTIEQSHEFIHDTSDDAVERLVDQLLASPRYGERWAQHWLDIAHYADTHGFERDQKRENAWRYRDYVIRSLNEDKAYDLFLKEQIAGDYLWPDSADAVQATGFLAAGPWDFVGQVETPSPQIKRLARADDLDDMVTQVLTSTCGITINCARCHNHKLDPIAQREYYQLTAVFAGTKRGEREANPTESNYLAKQRAELESRRNELKLEIAKLERPRLDLADIVGGGNGKGTGTRGRAFHVVTGKPQSDLLAFIDGIKPNQFIKVDSPFIDGFVVPDGGTSGDVVISSTGVVAREIPKTSAAAWDAIRNGPVNLQKSTTIGKTDYASEDHSILGLHANTAITFDLQNIRTELGEKQLAFETEIGYGGRPENNETVRADIRILVDGKTHLLHEGLNPSSGRIFASIVLESNVRFLTLMATDGGDGIGHDQVFFGDPRVYSVLHVQSEAQRVQFSGYREELNTVSKAIQDIPKPSMVYAIQSEPPPNSFVMKRGSPESLGESVQPGPLACVANASEFGVTSIDSDGARRAALANWITASDNPLMHRVIVNRLWHYHFGVGIVETPSDFGLGGGLPSHPELLEWLAAELKRSKYSLKSIHRLICTSNTYRQSSKRGNQAASSIDTNNRLLWRQNSRRLEAETLRDCVLYCTQSLNTQMAGPGFQDFEYQEEYAPIYRYLVPSNAPQFRRSVYRFVVRTTPHPFLTPLDCPNPATLTPARNVTTTAVQSLALWNNGFMLQQSAALAHMIKSQTESSDLRRQAALAFQYILGRVPNSNEMDTAASLLSEVDLSELCRALLNSNEFIYID